MTRTFSRGENVLALTPIFLVIGLIAAVTIRHAVNTLDLAFLTVLAAACLLGASRSIRLAAVLDDQTITI